MILGIDCPGMGSPHWNNQALLHAWPKGKGFAIGLFDGGSNSWSQNFGLDPSHNLRALLDENPDIPAAIITLFWTEVGPHILSPMGLVQRRASHYQNLSIFYPKTKFYLVHSGEYQIASVSGIELRTDLIKSVAPNCIPVNCPGNHITTKGIINKWDGINALANPGDIVSTDGANAFHIDIKAWKQKNSHASIMLAWGDRCNLWDGKEKPPPQRTNAPDAAYFKTLIHTIQE